MSGTGFSREAFGLAGPLRLPGFAKGEVDPLFAQLRV
jgi:hypothetical protein